MTSRYLYLKVILREVIKPRLKLVKRPLTLKLDLKKTTPNVRRILISQKTFANHLADEEAALAQQQQSGPSILVPGPKIGAILQRKASADIHTISDGSISSRRDPLSDEPLLRTYIPSEPSFEVMNALISGPPLSYNAARSAPPTSGKPQRHFCEICGYWGTIKCMKCGTRACGLDCKITHDDGRCLKFYA